MRGRRAGARPRVARRLVPRCGLDARAVVALVGVAARPRGRVPFLGPPLRRGTGAGPTRLWLRCARPYALARGAAAGPSLQRRGARGGAVERYVRALAVRSGGGSRQPFGPVRVVAPARVGRARPLLSRGPPHTAVTRGSGAGRGRRARNRRRWRGRGGPDGVGSSRCRCHRRNAVRGTGAATPRWVRPPTPRRGSPSRPGSRLSPAAPLGTASVQRSVDRLASLAHGGCHLVGNCRAGWACGPAASPGPRCAVLAQGG